MEPRPMRILLLAAIRAYQRYVSPYKGFCCAYRVHTGHSSCSALGYRAVRIHGVLAGLAILRERMHMCGVAHRRFTPRLPHLYAKQRGHVDLSCGDAGSCDFPSHDGMGAVCDVLDCCAGCDWPQLRRRRANDLYVYIPPKTNRH